MQLGFAKARNEITPEENVGVALATKALQNLELPITFLHG